ncbi:hypothetical protein H2204_001026 [Knufia peltigerae]|uniref:Uncharacterized protein n=1 Tax=Knufia peltigerae TaxID=1002370 RepID=A0AA38YDR1_9EURO|nr:hypothetical protein H2204_001026 [Knufia peltigerae]
MASTKLSEKLLERPKPDDGDSRLEHESDGSDDESSFEMILEDITTKKAERRNHVRQNAANVVVPTITSAIDDPLVDTNVYIKGHLMKNSTDTEPKTKTRTIPIHLDPYMAVSQNDEDGWTTITSDEVAEALADQQHRPAPAPAPKLGAAVVGVHRTARDAIGTAGVRRMIRHINNGMSVEEVARRFRMRGHPSSIVREIARFAAQRDADATNAGV